MRAAGRALFLLLASLLSLSVSHHLSPAVRRQETNLPPLPVLAPRTRQSCHTQSQMMPDDTAAFACTAIARNAFAAHRKIS